MTSLDWATEIVRRLQKAGFRAYFAGGCVRDMVMKKEPADYDIATNASCAIIQELFPHTVGVGVSFGVVLVIYKEYKCQVSTFRTDCADPREDALKRDFTINALFYDPFTRKIEDWCDGVGDIHRKLVKAVGIPQDRFNDDPLRLLRAVRMASTLDFSIEENTYQAIKRMAYLITKPSPERIRDELIRILSDNNACRGLELLDDTGLLREIFTRISPTENSAFSVRYDNLVSFAHNLLSYIREPDYILGISALLCGLETQSYPKQSDTLPTSIPSVSLFLRKYMFSNKDNLSIKNVLLHHLRFIYAQELSIGTKKKMMQSDTFIRELEFHRIHLCALGNKPDSYNHLKTLYDSLAPDEISPQPLISGTDLIELGINPSPELGKILADVEMKQLEGELTTREQALKLINKVL